MAYKKIGEVLIEKGIITKEQLEAALRRQRITGEKLGTVLIRMGLIDEDEFFNILAEQYNLEKYPTKKIVIKKDAQNAVSLKTAIEKEFVPLEIADEKLIIGISNHGIINFLDELEFETGKKVKPFLLPDNILKKILEDFKNFPYGMKDYVYIGLRDRIKERFGNKQVSIVDLLSVIHEVENYYDQIIFVDGLPPMLKKDDIVIKLNYNIITHSHIVGFIKDNFDEKLKKSLIHKGLIKSDVKIGTFDFSVSVLKQRGRYSLLFKPLKKVIPDIMDFHIEEDILKEFLNIKSGIYLISAPSGHGKTTIMTSIAQNFNVNSNYTILFVDRLITNEIRSNNSLVYQFEVGNDFPTYLDALKSDYFINANIIFLGNLTNFDELEMVLNLAEAGKKVFVSIECPNVSSALSYLLHLMGENKDRMLRRFVSLFRLCFVQRLIKIKNTDKKALIYEYVMENTRIRKFLMDEQLANIDNQLKGSSEYIPLEKKFAELVKKNVIEENEMFKYSLDYDLIKTYLS